MANTSSGSWHPDPTGRHQHRWWDGTAWTDQVSDGGATSTDPMTAAPAGPVGPSGSTGPSTSRKGPNWKLIGLVVGTAVVLIALVFIFTGDDGTDRGEAVDACEAGGAPRAQCECIVDSYLDAGGDLDDVDDAEFEDAGDLPPDLVEAVISCFQP